MLKCTTIAFFCKTQLRNEHCFAKSSNWRVKISIESQVCWGFSLFFSISLEMGCFKLKNYRQPSKCLMWSCLIECAKNSGSLWAVQRKFQITADLSTQYEGHLTFSYSGIKKCFPNFHGTKMEALLVELMWSFGHH